MNIPRIELLITLIVGLLSSTSHAERVYRAHTPMNGNALKVFVAAHSEYADKKVYISGSPSTADCVIYVTSTPSTADTKVYRVMSASNAHIRVLRTRSPDYADISVYFTNTPSTVRGRCGYAAALLN